MRVVKTAVLLTCAILCSCSAPSAEHSLDDCPTTRAALSLDAVSRLGFTPGEVLELSAQRATWAVTWQLQLEDLPPVPSADVVVVEFAALGAWDIERIAGSGHTPEVCRAGQAVQIEVAFDAATDDGEVAATGTGVLEAFELSVDGFFADLYQASGVELSEARALHAEQFVQFHAPDNMPSNTRFSLTGDYSQPLVGISADWEGEDSRGLAGVWQSDSAVLRLPE